MAPDDERSGSSSGRAVEIRGASASDVGLVRKQNEDSFGAYAQWRLFVVADGMGGAIGGKQASATAVQSIERRFSAEADLTASPTSLLEEAAQEANRAILGVARRNPDLAGMGTTLVAAWFPNPAQMALVSVGDSRVYRLRDDTLQPLTEDHSVVAEMVASGQITPAEARTHPRRHVLTRALGIEDSVRIDSSTFDVRPGDVYLLCSDGVHDVVPHDQVEQILVRNAADPSVASQALVAAANSCGGRDNATAVVVRCSEPKPDPVVLKAPIAPATVLSPGASVAGRYEVISVLGIGGMGIVYKVREHVGSATRFRALKTIRPEFVDADTISRFRQEAEKMCLLEHESIVPLIDYSDAGQMPYLVTPFIEGQTLHEYLSECTERTGRGVPLDDVCDIGLQLVSALDFAHSFVNPDSGRPQPIIHRDIKPGNIMVRTDHSYGSPQLKVLVMDFGIAKAISEDPRGRTLTQVVGTIKYAPPEQLRRTKDVDARTDIYSLGMVLYELHCGRHMLASLSEHAVLLRAVRPDTENLNPEFPPETPESFQSLIRDCVAANRDDRPSSMAEVGARLAPLSDRTRDA